MENLKKSIMYVYQFRGNLGIASFISPSNGILYYKGTHKKCLDFIKEWDGKLN